MKKRKNPLDDHVAKSMTLRIFLRCKNAYEPGSAYHNVHQRNGDRCVNTKLNEIGWPIATARLLSDS
jgi:hypothetical protein